jgi:hypothetical protein
MGVHHGLALEEAVDVMYFQCQPIEPLLLLHVAHFRLCLSHLERNQSFLDTLLGLPDATLHPIAMAFNLVTQSRLHLLELIENELQVWVSGILQLGLMEVVVGIRLHGSKNLIPDY